MKRLVRSRWTIVLVVLTLVVGTGAWFMAHRRTTVSDALVARVKKSEFAVTVTNSGELRAPKFVKITGPQDAQQAEQYQMKIQSIIPEGTVVKEGDPVATIDRAQIATKLTDVDLAFQKAEAQYQQASLDSTLNLSKAREEMRTAALTLEEMRLARDQSQFEAPSVKRQAEIAYEKSLRALRQDSLDLKTKTDQAIAKMREVGTDLTRQQNKLAIIKDVMSRYSVTAPAAGMVIYMREWDGRKRQAGSQIGAWDPVIATLPDLSVMESVTYVNEIDVRKLAVGQPVVLSLDADPRKKFTGKVTEVANAGEQRPNSDAKVFEVHISVEHPDTTLRPGMTTSNVIETYKVNGVLHIPLEAVLTEQNIPYVYRSTAGRTIKQEVETGAMNDDEIVVTRGLEPVDAVYLSPPAGHEQMTVVRLPGSKAGLAGDTATGARLPPVKTDSGKVAAPGTHPAGTPPATPKKG